MSWDALKNTDPEEAKEVTWGDYGRAAGSTVAGIGAGSSGLMRQMFEAGQNPNAAKLFQGLQLASRNLGEDIEGGMTEEGRARNAAGVTTEKFWEHPVSSIALKAVGMSPYLVAAAIPGALIGDSIAGMAAVGGTAGWLAAGDVADEITKKPDKMSDADLRAQSPLYAGFRDDGVEEKEARQQLNQIMVGAKPALAFMLGAATGVLGPAGNIARGLGRGAIEEAATAAGKTAASKGTGFIGQHGIRAAAAEGGATELAEEGYGAYAAQKAEIEGGLRKSYDQSEMLDRALTGMVLGTGFGAVSGIGGGKGKAKADEIRAAQEQGRGEEVAAVQTPVGTEGVAAQAAPPPAARGKAAKAEAVVGIDPAIELALADTRQPTATSAQAAAEAAIPPTPATPPAQPPAAAAQPVAQQASPTVPPPQQPPGVPPSGAAAAPVTSGVTPTQHSEQTLTELTRRGIDPVAEAPQLTPEQAAKLIQDLPPGGAAPAGAPTGSSVESRTTVPSPAAEVATPPVARPTTEPLMPSAGGEVATPSALPLTPPNIPAIPAVAAKPEGRKRGKAEVASIAHRAKQAKTVYDAAREPLGEISPTGPVARPVREAMALKIQGILDKAAAQGMVLRENLPAKIRANKGLSKEEKHQFDTSIPKYVGDADMSPHVTYLRELVGIQNALRGPKFGPKSSERARVVQFLTEHNLGEEGLALLSKRRIEEGAAAKARRGQVTEQTQEGVAKAAVVTKQSEGAASEVRNRTEELRAQYEKPGVGPKGAEALAVGKQEEKPFTAEPSAAAEVATAPAVPVTKKPPSKGKEKVREVREAKAPPAETKPEITEGTTTEPIQAKAELVAEKQQEEVTPEVTPVKPAAKKGVGISMQTRGDLKGLGWTEGDIKNMTAEEAEHKAYEGIAKGAAEPAAAVEEEAVPEGLTAKQAKAFLKLSPEGKQQVRAALEARSPASDKQQGRMKELAEDVSESEDMTLEELLRSIEQSREVKLNKDEYDIWETSTHKARDLFGHEDSALSAPMKTSDVLRSLDLSHLGKFPKYIQDFVRRRLTEILDNTPLYIASNELMADTHGVGQHQTPGGHFTRDNRGGWGHIVINQLVADNPAEFSRVVIHEALHAALSHRLNYDKNFRTKIKILMTVLDRDTKGHKDRRHVNYALKDEHEFVSEALSNKNLQALMRKMDIEPEVAEALGIKQKELKSNTLWGAFVAKVRQTLKIPEGTYNLLDETLKVVAPHLEAERSTAVRRGLYTEYGSGGKQAALLDVDALRSAAVGKATDTRVNVKGKLGLAKDKISTLWDMSGRGEQSSLFGASNPLNRLFDLRAKMEAFKSTVLEKYGAKKATLDIALAERKYPELMRRIKDIAFRASLHDVNLDGSNEHLGKDRMMGIQAKGEIAQLQREWNDKSLDPVRNTVRGAMKFFKDIHNATSRATIRNLLAEANIHDNALAERIHTTGLTEEDAKTWADTKLVSALDQVAALKRRQGSFIPFRRYGDFISAAEHELSVPANATKINDNTLQFLSPDFKHQRSRAMAKGYLRSNSHTPQGNQLTPVQVRQVWVDKTNPTQLVEGEDVNAVKAYRVSMQTQHVEMHETRAEAQRSQADLEQAGLLNARQHKREEAYRTDVTNIQSAMGTVLRSLEKQQRFIDADSAQKLAMREMFHDLSIGLSGATSIKNSMRQRRNVAGMSHDLGRVTADYGRMTANHLAKLEYRPQFDAVFKEMREHMKGYRNDKDAVRREEVYKEFVDRIYGRAADRADEHKGGFITRTLQLTRLAFLAGPSYHIINAHEVATTSMPVVAGRHGLGSTLRAMADAYNSIGGRRAVMSGFKDLAKAFTNDSGFTDYVKLFKETIGKSKTAGPDKIRRQQDMLDYMNARNLFSNTSIFEMAKYANPDGNIAGRALDRADLMANQVGTAIEAINRSVTGLMAYNLEYKKNGGNHEAAMHYAYSTAMNTMGDYSSWNAAPVFNTTLGRPLLQFKKFPQKTYMLLGNIMGGALKGDPQAMKQFAGLMVTHGLVAGALGMPTEPIKAALLAANALGVTGFTPDDYEYAMRRMMANLAGQKGGEILSKGIYRGLGIELSGRMGLDSLLLRGVPKSQKDADLKSFLFDTMAGASGSFMLGQIQGAQLLMKGDVVGALEKMSPLRTVGDITKAAVGLAGEKKGAGGKTTQEQFSAWEALVRTLGFTPSSKAELGAFQGTVKRESMRESGMRTALTRAWADATGAEKVKVQRAVQEFNAGRDRDQQITQKDLSNAVKRSKAEDKKTEHGITVSKRTKAIYDRAESVFNP